jgi:hypothetical protein
MRKRKRMPQNFAVFIARAHQRFVQNVQENNRPDVNWWGCFAVSDASVVLGGGVGHFSWHATRPDLCAFISEVLPYITGTSGQHGAVAEVTTAIVANMQHGVISDIEGIERLNHVLKHYSQISWIGTFGQLCISDDAFCTNVRSWFRRQTDDTPKVEYDRNTPIQPDELKGFYQAIQEYGL